MTSVFIVRPFGKKSVPLRDDKGTVTIVDMDFDEVQRSLIDKAVAKCGLTAETTGVIARAGNIRLDIFQMLVAYDLVIADISVENANAFYELGIRHGLRPKGTILIRFSTGKDVPFDLKTDRYLEYDRTKPEAAVDQLARMIEETRAAVQAVDQKPDSPVFLLLPELDAPDPGKLLVVPRDFQEAVERAAAKSPDISAPTLALLGKEARGNRWAREGVRLVARAQFGQKNWKAAREAWEFIMSTSPTDIEANRLLATVYHQLGDPVASSQACKHVLDDKQAKREDRADVRAQLARNEKALWVAAFIKMESEQERRRQALADPRLIRAFKGYMRGFTEDLNSYYSGINALGLSQVIVQLAELEPDTWAENFESDQEGADALSRYRGWIETLRVGVRLSLDVARQREAGKASWISPSEAHLAFLTASQPRLALFTTSRPRYVANAYRKAKIEIGSSPAIMSEARQVAIFQSLGLFTDNCAEALRELGVPPATAATPIGTTTGPRDRVIVATGHRADAAGRAKPRFPNTPECIAKAKAWLHATISAEKARTAGNLSGIGGGASGTDLLFHDVCAELGIPTKLVLPISAVDYCRESVADGGADWIEMFDNLVVANPPIVLSENPKLPSWAMSIPNYSVYQRGNIWMMQDALLRPNTDTALLALWNCQSGDGPGGTADMLELATNQGARKLVKDTNELFGIG